MFGTSDADVVGISGSSSDDDDAHIHATGDGDADSEGAYTSDDSTDSEDDPTDHDDPLEVDSNRGGADLGFVLGFVVLHLFVLYYFSSTYLRPAYYNSLND